MWKDYFYYSKGERSVLLFLVFVILLILAARLFLPGLLAKQEMLAEACHSSDEMELFLQSVQEREAKKKVERTYTPPKKRALLPVDFDPNTTDSLQFYEMGLPDWLIRRIMNYRRANGVFATADALGRIYGMSDELFKQLKPHVMIADSFKRTTYYKKEDDSLALIRYGMDSLRSVKYPEGTLVDLNSGDTTAFKMIPGIGSGIARMLVAHREYLGGFYTVEQLVELQYVKPELWVWFVVEEPPTPTLEVNKASLDRLRAHPYLNFYQAKVIVEHRKRRGEIKSLSQLSLYEEFTEKDLERLSYYLKFD